MSRFVCAAFGDGRHYLALDYKAHLFDNSLCYHFETNCLKQIMTQNIFEWPTFLNMLDKLYSKL